MKRFYLYSALVVCVLLVAVGLAFTASPYRTTPVPTPPRSLSTPQSDAPQATSTKLPSVSSKVEGVRLERLRLDDHAESMEFDIVNNTEKAILSVTLRSGNYSQTYNPYGDEVFILPGFKSEDGRFYLKDIVKNSVTLTAVEFVGGELQGTDFDKQQFLYDRKKKAEGRAPAFQKNHKPGGVKQ